MGENEINPTKNSAESSTAPITDCDNYMLPPVVAIACSANDAQPAGQATPVPRNEAPKTTAAEHDERMLLIKNGRCPSCGIQTHKKKGLFRKTLVPLTTDDVRNGRCLDCKPLAQAPTAAARPAPAHSTAGAVSPYDPPPSSSPSWTLGSPASPSAPPPPPPSHEMASLSVKADPSFPSTSTSESRDRIYERAAGKCGIDDDENARPSTIALEEARSLHRLGVSSGVHGGAIETSVTAFERSRAVAKDWIAQTHADNNCGGADAQCSGAHAVAWRDLSVRILIDYANLRLMLREWKEAKNLLLEAAASQEVLARISKEDTDGPSLLLADIYRGLSVADYYCKTSGSCEVWTIKGLEILREMQRRKGKRLCSQGQLLLGTFLAYQATDVKDDPERSLSLYGEGIEVLEKALAANLGDPLFPYRFAMALRNSSYDLRKAGRAEEAGTNVERAKNAIKRAADKHPSSPLYVNEYFVCCDAAIDHHVATNGGGKEENAALLALREEAAEAGRRVTDILSTSTFHLNSYMWTLRSLAHLQEWMDENNDAKKTWDKAAKVAERCAQSPRAEFVHQYNQACVLAECGRITNLLGRHRDALVLYDRAYDAYAAHVLENTQREEEHVETFARAMANAQTCAAKAGESTRSVQFIKRAVEVGKSMKERKNQQLHATHLDTLAGLYMDVANYSDAGATYQEILSFIKALYETYPWHYYIAQSYGNAQLGLAKAHQVTGNTTAEATARRAYLKQQGALHGKDYGALTDDSTDATAEKLRELREKCEDVPRVLHLSIPCLFNDGTSRSPYTVHIVEAIPGKDPLEDQARVLREDSNGTIPEDVWEGIRNIHRLSLENNTSFQDLCEHSMLNKDERPTILNTAFPENYYDKQYWHDNLTWFYGENQSRLDMEHLNVAVDVLAEAMYDIIEVYGNFPQIVYDSLGQTIDPLFEAEEYKKEIYDVVYDAGVKENRPLLIKYAKGLLKVRKLAMKDRLFYDEQFSDLMAEAGEERFMDVISDITKIHVTQIRQKIAERTE